MSTHDVDGLNAGYARALLDEYLENPEAVPSEWRALFESGDSQLVASHPGIARLLEKLPRRGERRQRPRQRRRDATAPRAARRAAAAPPRRLPRRPTRSSSAASPPRWRSSRRTARTATSPRGSTRSAPSRSAIPSLEPLRLEPKLTPELQARIPASVLRVARPRRDARRRAARGSRETYCGTIAYELEHLSDHQQRVWLRQAIESGRYRTPLSADEKKRSSAGSARSRAWSGSCASGSSGRSSSRSRAST